MPRRDKVDVVCALLLKLQKNIRQAPGGYLPPEISGADAVILAVAALQRAARKEHRAAALCAEMQGSSQKCSAARAIFTIPPPRKACVRVRSAPQRRGHNVQWVGVSMPYPPPSRFSQGIVYHIFCICGTIFLKKKSRKGGCSCKKCFIRQKKSFWCSLQRSIPPWLRPPSEIINLQAILRLPKPTEHFMSDLHGESDAFTHILGNASGVIKEKVDRVLAGERSDAERAEFATLIYYPAQKLAQLKPRQSDLGAWYRKTLYRLIDVCRMMSSKYTRSFVRKRLPGDFAYILDELLHAHFEDHDKEFYYGRILDSIIDIGRADDFITALAQLIQRLAVYRLHIVGDIFDRGPRPDIILDELMRHHSVDVQWGNHDVQWMGAAAGSTVCVASVIHVTLSYNNLETLEDGYGISLRPLSQYAEEVYRDTDVSGFGPKLVEEGEYTPG